MGLRNWRGISRLFASSSDMMKKLLEPVARPRLMAKMSPRVSSPVLLTVVVAGNCVHLRDRRRVSSGMNASLLGASIEPAKEKRMRCSAGGGDLRNTTTADDTSASVNWTSVGQPG